MAKSAHSTQFRKVDVDAFDEERYEDDTAAGEAHEGPTEGEIQNLLNSKKNSEALKMLLKDPPQDAKETEKKAQAFALVMRVLAQFKAAEIDGAVKNLSSEETDVLMKYIYRGFQQATENSCGILLQFHEKALAKGGLGSVMRVMTDRKTV